LPSPPPPLPAIQLNPLTPTPQVPLELIEWQPVYHQRGAVGIGGGEWSANWEVTRSTKVRRRPGLTSQRWFDQPAARPQRRGARHGRAVAAQDLPQAAQPAPHIWNNRLERRPAGALSGAGAIRTRPRTAALIPVCKPSFNAYAINAPALAKPQVQHLLRRLLDVGAVVPPGDEAGPRHSGAAGMHTAAREQGQVCCRARGGCLRLMLAPVVFPRGIRRDTPMQQLRLSQLTPRRPSPTLSPLSHTHTHTINTITHTNRLTHTHTERPSPSPSSPCIAKHHRHPCSRRAASCGVRAWGAHALQRRLCSLNSGCTSSCCSGSLRHGRCVSGVFFCVCARTCACVCVCVHVCV
jgi:hypothetical protein